MLGWCLGMGLLCLWGYIQTLGVSDDQGRWGLGLRRTYLVEDWMIQGTTAEDGSGITLPGDGEVGRKKSHGPAWNPYTWGGVGTVYYGLWSLYFLVGWGILEGSEGSAPGMTPMQQTAGGRVAWLGQRSQGCVMI